MPAKNKVLEEKQEAQGAEGRWSKAKELTIAGLALASTIALCVLVVIHWDFVIKAQNYGYFGVFIISVLSSIISFIPIPSLMLVFTLGSVINPIIIGIISGLGEAVGSIGIYLTGYGGRGTVHYLNQKFYGRFEGLIQQRGSLAVFFMSAIFNPLFLPFTVVVGLLRFGLVKFFFLCWGGKAVKNTVVASLGYFGLGSILRLFGIGV
jgi:membrane protein YqaA with SNARE-associated domain